MPTIPNTIADLRRWLMDHIDALDSHREDPDPSEHTIWECAWIARQAGDLLARRGFSDLYEESRKFREFATPEVAKAFLVKCLGAVDALPRVSDPPPPVFNAEQAADYLGLTRGQIYQQVEEGSLDPTGRGPRNSLLFTSVRLDSYAQQQ
jgi:hypothetical protein